MSTETTTTNKTCAKCKFWDRAENNQGSCRRHAPQTVVFELSLDKTMKTVFPVTNESDWCGEYEQR